MLEFFALNAIGYAVVTVAVDIYQKAAPVVVSTVTAVF